MKQAPLWSGVRPARSLPKLRRAPLFRACEPDATPVHPRQLALIGEADASHEQPLAALDRLHREAFED
jgi:hypothetical protein